MRLPWLLGEALLRDTDAHVHDFRLLDANARCLFGITVTLY